MIISHKHKFIFFAIPKTGTHSIRFALRPFLDEIDEEHVGLFHHSKLKIEAFKDRNNGHITVEEIKPYLNNDIFNSYYKFSFVRNPFDRFISTCFFKNKFVKQNPTKATEIIKLIAKKELKNRSFFYQSQSHYIQDSDEKIVLDFVGKLEQMQDDFNSICKRINIPHQLLEKRNQSEHNNYQVYYDNELIDLVIEMYQEDLQNFNYDILLHKKS